MAFGKTFVEAYGDAQDDNSFTLTLVSPDAIPAGHGIVVTMAQSGSGIISSLADSVGNTYVKRAGGTASSNNSEAWDCLDNIALPSGGTISITLSGGDRYKHMAVYSLGGAAAFVTGRTVGGSGSTITVTSDASASAGAVAVVAWCANAGGLDPTTPSDWTVDADVPSSRHRVFASHTTSASGTVTYSSTLDSSRTWRAAMAVYESAGSSSQDGNASGAMLVVSATLLPGSASATRSAEASGTLLSSAVSFIPGSASVSQDGTAPGETFVSEPALIPGSASATRSGAGLGGLLAAEPSFLPGSASATASPTAPGETWVVAATFLPGSASGSETAHGEAPGALLAASPSFLPGSASGQANATVSGMLFASAPVLLPGEAFGTRSGTGHGILLTAGITAFFGIGIGENQGGEDPAEFDVGGEGVVDTLLPEHVAYEDGGVVRRTT